MKKICKEMDSSINIFLHEFVFLFFLLVVVKSYPMEKQGIHFLSLPEDILKHILYFAEPISKVEMAYWDFIHHNDIRYYPTKTLSLMYEYYKKISCSYSPSVDSDDNYLFNKECAFLKLIEEKTSPLVVQYPARCALRCTCKQLLHLMSTFKKNKHDFFSQLPQEISVSNFFIYAVESNFFKPYMLNKSIFFGVDDCFAIASAVNKKEKSFLRIYFDLKDNVIVLQERTITRHKYSFKKMCSLFYYFNIKNAPCIMPTIPTAENRVQSSFFLLAFYKKYFDTISATVLHSFLIKIIDPALCEYSTVPVSSYYVQSGGILTGMQYCIYDTMECKISLPISTDVIINLFKAKAYPIKKVSGKK
jgi:hypothetical protein